MLLTQFRVLSKGIEYIGLWMLSRMQCESFAIPISRKKSNSHI